MKKIKYLLTAVFIGLSLLACKEKMEVPTVLTHNVTSIEQTTATGGGEIVSNGGSPILTSGICWDTNENPTISNSKTSDKLNDNMFISKMTNLLPNTTYYVRAYATNAEGIGYGAQVSFKTLSVIKADISIQAPENVTSGTIEGIRAEIVSDGGSAITECGFVWGMEPEPTIEDGKTVSSLEGNKFSAMIDDLMPDSTYFVRAYAINQAGVAYSKQFREVKMLPVASEVSILKIDSVTAVSVKITVTAESADNFNPITEQGIHFSIEKEGVIAENHVAAIEIEEEFIAQVDTLTPQTKYYVMPYAKNKYGIKYGVVKEFTTKQKATE